MSDCLPPRMVFLFLALHLASPGIAADSAPAASQPPKPTRLEPFQVRDRPITSFGIALVFLINRGTQKVHRMFISDVLDGSEAQSKGLRRGSEILSVNGESVSSLDYAFSPESDLHRLFINRKRHDRISLELASAPGKPPRTVILTEGRDPTRPLTLQWFDVPW